MESVSELIAAVKRFVFNNTQGLDAFQGAFQGPSDSLEEFIDDAILQAANNALLYGQRGHDFEANKVTVAVSLPAGGELNLDSLGGHKMRTIESVVVPQADGDFLSLHVTDHKDLVIKKRINQSLYTSPRYPSTDAFYQDGKLLPSVFVDGRKLKMNPPLTEAINIEVRGSKWLTPYSKTGTAEGREYVGGPDYFLQHGSDWLMWRCIVELNFIVQIYVPRQEGSLAPPDRQEAIAWDNLVKNDAYSVLGNIYHE